MTDRDVGSAGAAPARPSTAEQARTIAAGANAGTLATLTVDGDPWASFVGYGLLGGAPVFCLSKLAEHGRNVIADPRASLSVATANDSEDPLSNSRITLAGVVTEASGADRDAARAAYLQAIPAARAFVDFSDFTLYVLRVDRVRWFGGYARAGSASGERYLAAEPDPVTPAAGNAIAHLNADHADALVSMARAFGGHPDADGAKCIGIDRYGLDLRVHTSRGVADTRVGFPEPLQSARQLRAITKELSNAANAAR